MRETDAAFGDAHARHLADYREGTAQVWCSNTECVNSDQPTTVGWTSEYGQGTYLPEQCECGSEWTEDAPEDRIVSCVSCSYPFDTGEERVETPQGTLCPDCAADPYPDVPCGIHTIVGPNGESEACGGSCAVVSVDKLVHYKCRRCGFSTVRNLDGTPTPAWDGLLSDGTPYEGSGVDEHDRRL